MAVSGPRKSLFYVSHLEHQTYDDSEPDFRKSAPDSMEQWTDERLTAEIEFLKKEITEGLDEEVA